MGTFVLIHGAGSGAWVWHKVAPRLERQGHTVITPDLPGHGRNPRPMAEITLARYADSVCDILRAQSEPVVLVGHSLGGAVISQAAEACPEKIQTLVYLAGYLLRNGESPLDISQTDSESLMMGTAVFSDDQLSATCQPEALQELGYADCSAEDMALVRLLITPQAVAPLSTPVQITAERGGRVPKVYILCTQDKVIGPATQRRMAEVGGCDRLLTLDTSHNPYLSAPQAVADCLLTVL
ncbi:alpha/beta fold hydrolase [Synechococcus elongatus]|uniref:Alpha/beta fold hydrolase n=1 Tax=Synechococcus elongatus PCC 11802 TaxID=2283154 RepID=A0AAT9JVI8_SYNEL|nr:alpha/beta fold hydrolase [Synechococcus elongatus]QFZ92845.1 alpha/beta fold hydrolase [Synechococcus elongatus PCC 11802]